MRKKGLEAYRSCSSPSLAPALSRMRIDLAQRHNPPGLHTTSHPKMKTQSLNTTKKPNKKEPTDPPRLPRIHRPPRKNQLLRLRPAYQPRCSLRAARAGYDSELALREAEFRYGRGCDDIIYSGR